MAKPKMDSDKDLLLSKILPALTDNAFSTLHQQDVIESDSPLPLPELPGGGEDLQLAALRSKLFARSSEYMPDTFATINVMENLVLKHIDAALQRFNTCTCDCCRSHVASHALNNLPPQYIVSHSDHFEMRDDDDAATKQVMNALVNAVLHIRSHPKH